MSKRQEKIEINKAEREDFLKGREREEIEKRWHEAQLKAATMQSVLDYMIHQYDEHKEELPEDIVAQTEEQIEMRRSEIKAFLLAEQEACAKAMEEYNKTV
jgi:hypothetical protein